MDLFSEESLFKTSHCFYTMFFGLPLLDSLVKLIYFNTKRKTFSNHPTTRKTSKLFRSNNKLLKCQSLLKLPYRPTTTGSSMNFFTSSPKLHTCISESLLGCVRCTSSIVAPHFISLPCWFFVRSWMVIKESIYWSQTLCFLLWTAYSSLFPDL